MIRAAKLEELRERGMHLVEAAAEETGVGRDVVRWDILEGFEKAGLLRLLVVEVDGELVGHCCSASSPEVFSADVCCQTLSVFVQPRHRGRWGKRLLLAMRDAAFVAGDDEVRVNVLAWSRLERLLRGEWGTRNGFRVASVAFAFRA